MDWKECIQRGLAKKINKDTSLIKSLIETSRNKEKSASLLGITEITSVSIVSLYYDSLRELMEAIAVSNGYKIYNHESYTCFFREVLHMEKFSFNYDSIRKIRNGLNYYGRKYH